MLETNNLGWPTGGWLLWFFDPQKLITQPQGLGFDTDMPSAVSTIPVKVDFGQGPKDCTMVGGLLAHSLDKLSYGDPVTLLGQGFVLPIPDSFYYVQPMPGWLFYIDNSPATAKTKEVIVLDD
ncbi:hypothetical protein F25303_2202 [Fusarium sp. NRRL 25303]|nr:hypothetical protein F25303_2202 [Fusarium sp. NRRL 25303]